MAAFPTAGDDSINGTSGPDTIDALAGNDVVNGQSGDDDLDGGDDNDTINGDDGNDTLRVSGTGTESVNGGADFDTIIVDYGDAATNIAATFPGIGNGNYSGTIGDGAARRITYTGIEKFNITTGSGNDDVRTGVNADIVNLGDGNDFYLDGIGSANDDVVDAGAGEDGLQYINNGITAIVFDLQADAYSGSTGTFTNFEYFTTIITGSGSDVIVTTGANRDENILTNIGADRITVVNGHDTVDGGTQDDLLIVDYSGSGTAVTMAAPTPGTHAMDPNFPPSAATGLKGVIGDGGTRQVTYDNIERFDVTGGSGNDSIVTAAGSDFIRLQVGGVDQASSGAGDDIIYFGAALTGADSVDGGAGTRDVLVLQGNYNAVISASALTGIEFLSLQSGSVTTFGDSAGNSYDYSLAIADSAVGAGQRLVINGQSLQSGEDMDVNGTAESDGNFLAYAGNGGDHLTGGAGNDIFFFEGTRFNAGDTADGGGGRDAVVITGAISGMNNITIGDGVFTSIEAISVNGRFASDPSVVPSYHLVIGNHNATSGTLTINASSLGATQVAEIDASAVTDGMLSIFGGAGIDLLIGGALADTIMGGLESDTLYGGAGNDSFRYDSIHDSEAQGNRDGIQDFALGDKIDLSRIDAIEGSGGNDAFTFIGDGAFSGAAGELRAFHSGSSPIWTVSGDVNGDKIADIEFSVVVLDNATHPLTGADFVL